ncbi:MAG: hypothetical protein V3V26_00760 [Candidatus Aenigmarchaeota archaeon]
MQVKKEHLKLYMLGVAAAVGLAIVLQNQLGNRVQLSLGTAKKDPPKGLDRVKVQIKEVKNKLKGKEKKLKEGHTIFLKDIIGDIAMARSPKKDVAELEKKKRKLKEAAVDYIAEEMEEKLEDIGMKRKDMMKIVDSVSDIAEALIEGENLVAVIRKFDDLSDQLTFLMKKIHPKLIQAIKKDQRS